VTLRQQAVTTALKSTMEKIYAQTLIITIMYQSRLLVSLFLLYDSTLQTLSEISLC